MLFSIVLPLLLSVSRLAAARPQAALSQIALLDSHTRNTMPSTSIEEKVPGNNNATFGNVPRTEQLFSIEFLEVAPDPVPVNQIFFVYLRGTVAEAPGLEDATLRITGESEHESAQTYSIPLHTAAYGDHGHLAVRYADGTYGGPLVAGRNDVMADMLILGMFVRTGWWTFQIEAQLPDGRNLFCFQTTQWLEHKNS